MRPVTTASPYDGFVMPIDVLETRSLTVVLSETEWLALRTVERDPIAYLKDQIKSRLKGEAKPDSSSQSAFSETDDY